MDENMEQQMLLARAAEGTPIEGEAGEFAGEMTTEEKDMLKDDLRSIIIQLRPDLSEEMVGKIVYEISGDETMDNEETGREVVEKDISQGRPADEQMVQQQAQMMQQQQGGQMPQDPRLAIAANG